VQAESRRGAGAGSCAAAGRADGRAGKDGNPGREAPKINGWTPIGRSQLNSIESSGGGSQTTANAHPCRPSSCQAQKRMVLQLLSVPSLG
jgi:hypothetical protein